MAMLKLVSQNLVEEMLGAGSKTFALVMGPNIQSTEQFQHVVAEQKSMIVLVLTVLLLYPATNSNPETAGN